MFTRGDLIPDFLARGAKNPNYSIGAAAGRYVVLTFLASTRVPGVETFLEQLYASAAPFDDAFASIFLISNDPDDEQEQRLQERYPGIRVFWDCDSKLLKLFGCAGPVDGDVIRVSLNTFIVDPAMRVVGVVPFVDPSRHFDDICRFMGTLSSPAEDFTTFAPVLIVPDLLEPELCRRYIDYARAEGAEESGFMRTDPETGKTVVVNDYSHKRRSDRLISDDALRTALKKRIVRRLVPQIKRAFQFEATRIERYVIGAYDAETGGYFRPHRDNTTKGTAHRRFAVSINLNPEEYEGGDLRFPEFGQRTYRPPTGGAVVFSCSLLHEATPVTVGTRYCILPFLYDEAAAQIRLANAQHLGDEALRDQIVRSVKAAGKRS